MPQWQPQQYDPRQHAQRLAPPTQWQPQYDQPVSSSEYREPMIVHPHAQQHVAPFPPQPRYQTPARRPARNAPPYPAHLVRFPAQAFPRPRRRRRGMSAYRIFYLGRHPIALLIEMCVMLIALEVILGYLALVVTAWACWTAAVTIVWLCQLAAARMRR